MATVDSSRTAARPVSVVFVCLGNICRSTMAEGVFQHVTKTKVDNPLIGNIDSAGTGGYHIGDDPDHRTMQTLRQHGITEYRHGARKIQTSDFTKFDYLFAMDKDNLSNLERIRRGLVKDGKEEEQLGKVMLFGDFGGKKGEEVADPYYGARDGFSTAYEQMVRFTEGFLKSLEKDYLTS